MPDDLTFRADDFSGTARLFPLPNLVLFPHVLQPLHVFELRYRALLAEAMAGDRLIAMAVLAPGWEQQYEGAPPLYPMACLGRVLTHQPLDDGRSNLLLAGVGRVRIEHELNSDKPFRQARVRLVDDYLEQSAAAIEERLQLQEKLLELFRRAAPQLGEAGGQLEQALGSNLSLAVLTDLAAYTLDLGIPAKHELLAEPDVDRRARRLIALLGASGGASSAMPGNFPPDFSEN